MRKIDVKRKRDRAIKSLRDLGMTDEEIANEIGCQVDELDDRVIDAEVISVVDHLPALVGTPTYGNLGVSQDGTEERKRHMPKPATRMRNDLAGEVNPVGVTLLSEEWWAAQLPHVAAKRCKRTKRDGTQCKRRSWKGQVVCGHHGAKAPLMMAKAKERLELASDRMAVNLLGLAENAETDSTKLAATNSALDRAGIVKPTQVDVGIGIKPYEEVFSGIQEGMTRAESRRARGIVDTDQALTLDDVTPLSDSQSEFYDATADYSARDYGGNDGGDCVDGNQYPTQPTHPNSATPTDPTQQNPLKPTGGIPASSARAAGPGTAPNAGDGVSSVHGERAYDRPSATQSDERGERRQPQPQESVSGSGVAVTGDAALAMAAALRRAQSDRYGLPEGQSTRNRRR